MTTNDNDILTGATTRDVANGNGSLLYSSRTGRTRRLSRASMSYRGVNIDCEYSTNNCIGPDACVEDVITVEANGADITPIFSEEQLGELRERIEASWEMEAQS